MNEPPLDLTDPAAKRMLAAVKKRGYVTQRELNEVLPPDTCSSEQIEYVARVLTDMGVRIEPS